MLLCYVILFDHYYLTIYFPARYNWNIIENGVKHYNSNPNYLFASCKMYFMEIFFFFLREGGSLIITLKKTFSCCNFLLAYLAMWAFASLGVLSWSVVCLYTVKFFKKSSVKLHWANIYLIWSELSKVFLASKLYLVIPPIKLHGCTYTDKATFSHWAEIWIVIPF